MKPSTSLDSTPDWRARSVAAVSGSLAASPVLRAAVVTLSMLSVTDLVLVAASWALRKISWVEIGRAHV